MLVQKLQENQPSTLEWWFGNAKLSMSIFELNSFGYTLKLSFFWILNVSLNDLCSFYFLLTVNEWLTISWGFMYLIFKSFSAADMIFEASSSSVRIIWNDEISDLILSCLFNTSSFFAWSTRPLYLASTKAREETTNKVITNANSKTRVYCVTLSQAVVRASRQSLLND